MAATVVRLPGLRRQRLLAALTQAELAAKAGVGRVTVSRLEQGHDCQPPTLRKLADALGVEPRALIEPD